MLDNESPCRVPRFRFALHYLFNSAGRGRSSQTRRARTLAIIPSLSQGSMPGSVNETVDRVRSGQEWVRRAAKAIHISWRGSLASDLLERGPRFHSTITLPTFPVNPRFRPWKHLSISCYRKPGNFPCDFPRRCSPPVLSPWNCRASTLLSKEEQRADMSHVFVREWLTDRPERCLAR